MNLLAQKKQLINTITIVLQRATENMQHTLARVLQLKKIHKLKREGRERQKGKKQSRNRLL